MSLLTPLVEVFAAFVPATAQTSDKPTLERVRINVRWLLTLRWAAAVGQLLTIAAVALFMDIELPLGELGAIVAVEFATNGALAWWFRREVAMHSWEQSHLLAERLLGLVMTLDMFLLTGLLYLTGGPNNPFCIFYMVNIALAAVVLKPRWALWLTTFAVACYSTIVLVHRPLPALETLASPPSPPGEVELSIRTQGLWFAVGGASFFIVYFITRVTAELTRREQELSEAQHRRAQTQKLEALATLAAGAAHELASPLSTIAVVARELELQLLRGGGPEGTAQDAALIRNEVARCRAILDQMAAGAGESVGEVILNLSASELVAATLDGLREAERVQIDLPAEVAAERLHVPQHALAHCLRGLLRNALDASGASGQVRMIVGRDRDRLTIEIRDQGTGMSPEILARAGDPFFTTKEPGQGMGLGLFLTRRVIERLSGTMDLSSVVGRGTTATIRLPLAVPSRG